MVALLLEAGSLHGLARADAADPPPTGESRQRWWGWCAWMQRCATRESDLERYGLHLDDGWRDKRDHGPVAVLVHGFNSTPARSRALLRDVRGAGLACGAFAYPNDQPLRASAELLSVELTRLAAEHPGQRVALVTHSMGGLVARECLENESLNPGNVDRLIMVAPPTHGSALARCAVGWDVWEHWLSRRDGWPWRRVRESIVDGMGEAPDDLRPGSSFLTRLNARQRAPGVRYTVLLGSDACLSRQQHAILARTLGWAAWCTPGVSGEPDAIAECLARFDEVMDGCGDGAVAVRRGRLDGVADTHVLPFGHLSVVRDGEHEIAERVRRMILERLVEADGA